MARSARQMETPDQRAPQGVLRDDRIAAPSSPCWGATRLQAWGRLTKCNGTSGKSPDEYRRFCSRRVQPCNESTSGLPAYRALLSAIICSKASTIRRRVLAPLQWAPPSHRLHSHQLEGKREEHYARRLMRTSLCSSRDTFQFGCGKFACRLRCFALNMFAVRHNTGSVRFDIEGSWKPNFARIYSRDRDVHHDLLPDGKTGRAAKIVSSPSKHVQPVSG